jgi:hypothetical protein
MPIKVLLASVTGKPEKPLSSDKVNASLIVNSAVTVTGSETIPAS